MVVDFVDSDGSIIVPKSVRPIIELGQTALGVKKGANKQYRYGNLHIREYDSHYTVHMDKVDPFKSPLGHLVLDAPEYIAGAAAAVIVARHVGAHVYNKSKNDGKTKRDAALNAAVAGCIAGSAAGRLAHKAVNNLKKRGE